MRYRFTIDLDANDFDTYAGESLIVNNLYMVFNRTVPYMADNVRISVMALDDDDAF